LGCRGVCSLVCANKTWGVKRTTLNAMVEAIESKK